MTKNAKVIGLLTIYLAAYRCTIQDNALYVDSDSDIVLPGAFISKPFNYRACKVHLFLKGPMAKLAR